MPDLMAVLNLHYERWQGYGSDSQFSDFLPAFLAGETELNPLAKGPNQDDQ